jgi:hypothetical protein
MTEDDLRRKLAAIEALLRGATSLGELDAARAAKDRIESRLGELPQDWYFTIHDSSSRKLFTALAGKLGVQTFRYRGQRRTSLVVNTTESRKEVLWRQFLDASEQLRKYLDEVTDRVISEVLGQSTDDVAERAEQKALPLGMK